MAKPSAPLSPVDQTGEPPETRPLVFPWHRPPGEEIVEPPVEEMERVLASTLYVGTEAERDL